MIGAYGSGLIIDMFTKDGVRHWPNIWLTFSAYALVIAILFMIMFKYKHDPDKMKNVEASH